jgi:competence protein ComEA
MLKKILTVLVTLFVAMGAAFAQVDANKGDQAALDSVKGIGPKISQTIVDERNAHGAFKDWADFEKRVKGVGDKKAAALSQAGLTVNGQPISNASMSSAGAGKKDASSASSPATGTGKPGTQTNSAISSGTKESSTVTQNAGTSAGKSSAQPPSSAKTGQSTSTAPVPSATTGSKASTPMNGAANGEGKKSVQMDPTKKSTVKGADSLTQNAAASPGKLATPTPPATSAK